MGCTQKSTRRDQAKITAAFIKPSKNTVQGKKIVDAASAGAYLPALDSEFDDIQNTARQLGLLGEATKITPP
jgi:ABC-type phosphate/phosphonate transport system substrate-binding protein